MYDTNQAVKLYLSALSKPFNDLVWIGQFHLGNIRIFLVINAKTRNSVSVVVPGTRLETEISELDTHFISTFWAPNSV